MLTAQDIKDKMFTKAVFGGYDMATVDEFLETVAEDYAALYKENAILKNKLKVLVEKVEEYRSTEDSMRLALLTAQKMSRDIVDQAEEKSRTLVDKAEADARGRIEALRLDVLEEERRLEAARKKTSDFSSAVRTICTRQLQFLDELSGLEFPPDAEPEPPGPSQEQIVDETARRIQDNFVRIIEESITTSDEPTPAPAKQSVSAAHDSTQVFDPATLFEELSEEPVKSLKPKFDIENLQFGHNYDTGKKK